MPLNDIPGEYTYQTIETLNGYVVIAQLSVEIYADENDVSETPLVSGIVVGMGYTKKRARIEADKQLQQSLTVLEAKRQSEGGA
jgi:hypothetical protein